MTYWLDFSTNKKREIGFVKTLKLFLNKSIFFIRFCFHKINIKIGFVETMKLLKQAILWDNWEIVLFITLPM